jgi:nucleoside-diphosphate-sugar epimerase
MKRVLVTGASGFVGRQTLNELIVRDFEVHAVARSGLAEASRSAVHYHACDLLDSKATRDLLRELKPTHLLHLAWYAKPGLFWASLENLRWVAASLDLYLAFADVGGTRAVMAGTCAEYDWGYALLDERETPLAPRTLYGQCKRVLHALLEEAGRQTAVSLAWGRIFFVYGPHEPRGRLVSDVTTALLEGREAQCSSGTQERDYMHVHDVGRAFVALVDSDITGPVNIASGDCVAVRSIISTLGSLTGGAALIRFGARPQPDDPPRLAASIGILKDRLGFRPVFDLAGGLADTVRWWRTESA